MSSRQIGLWKWQRRFAVMFIMVGGLCLSIPLRSEAQVSWTVTIDFSGVGEVPKYKVDRNPPSGGGCNYPAPADGYLLRICQNDTLSWKASTPGASRDVAIFLKHAILDDAGTRPHWFKTHDANATPPAKPYSGIIPDDYEEYEYSVAVYDRTNMHLYAHDPKVIIGTGSRATIDEILETIEQTSKELKKDLAEDAQLFKTKDEAKEAEEDADKIHKLVEEIRNKLHSR